MADPWGNTNPRSADYCVFHDESEPNKRWLLIGLLFVPRQHLDKARDVLRESRRFEDCYGEIHFSDLPKSFEGRWGAKARVARAWMLSYQEKLSEYVFFSVLAVDRHSPKYEHKHFKEDFHAYNRFTAMALKAGITWHLGPQQLDELAIHFVSDKKDRANGLDGGAIDNFESYLPYRVELDASSSRKYPLREFFLELRDSRDDDLLQLCDLLLGATQMALVAGSERPTKRELGQMVARWCDDLRCRPQQQTYGLHRKYNLWAFPDPDGKPYNRLPLALKADDR